MWMWLLFIRIRFFNRSSVFCCLLLYCIWWVVIVFDLSDHTILIISYHLIGDRHNIVWCNLITLFFHQWLIVGIESFKNVFPTQEMKFNQNKHFTNFKTTTLTESEVYEVHENRPEDWETHPPENSKYGPQQCPTNRPGQNCQATRKSLTTPKEGREHRR